MGISYEAVTGTGIVLYSEDKIKAFAKHINPNVDYSMIDDLEISLYENDLDKHISMKYVGNLVTGKDVGVFIGILSDRGRLILESFGEPIKKVNEVCIM